MKQGHYIVALILGMLIIFSLSNYIYDRRIIAIIGLSYLAAIVYMSKRKKRTFVANDSDICLSLGSLIHQQSPANARDNHVVFYRDESRSLSVLWGGRFLNQSTVFSLSDNAQANLYELFQSLHEYYVQNRLGNWNIAHFTVFENKTRFDLKVDFDRELSQGLITFDAYIRRFM